MCQYTYQRSVFSRRIIFALYRIKSEVENVLTTQLVSRDYVKTSLELIPSFPHPNYRCGPPQLPADSSLALVGVEPSALLQAIVRTSSLALPGSPYRYFLDLFWGFPGGTSVQNLPASAGDVRDMGLIPGLGRSPGGGQGNPLQYCCLQRSLVGYSPQCQKELDTIEGTQHVCIQAYSQARI